MLVDAAKWVIWLFLITGIIWLVLVILRNRRPDLHEKGTDDWRPDNHFEEEITSDGSKRQRKDSK